MRVYLLISGVKKTQKQLATHVIHVSFHIRGPLNGESTEGVRHSFIQLHTQKLDRNVYMYVCVGVDCLRTQYVTADFQPSRSLAIFLPLSTQK